MNLNSKGRFRSSLRKDSRKLRIDGSRKATVLVTMREMKFLPNAFANAEGGTLVLGLHETTDDPRRAERLDPLPNCEGLARRILDASEDIVEPRLRSIKARALPADKAGNGYVVLRVGKSAAGPHRLRSTKEFYIRRGESREDGRWRNKRLDPGFGADR